MLGHRRRIAFTDFIEIVLRNDCLILKVNLTSRYDKSEKDPLKENK